MGNKKLGIFILIAIPSIVTQATLARAAKDIPLTDDVPQKNKRIALKASPSGSCHEVKEYIVGDDKGWSTNIDYTAWANGKEFRVGDILVFDMTCKHNLLVVDEDGYNRCCGASRVVDIRETGRHSIVFTAKGTFGFISNIGNDCRNGMKLLVTVKE